MNGKAITDDRKSAGGASELSAGLGVRCMRAKTPVVTQQMVRMGIDALTSRGHELPYDESALEVIVVEVYEAMAASDQTLPDVATKSERTGRVAKCRP